MVTQGERFCLPLYHPGLSNKEHENRPRKSLNVTSEHSILNHVQFSHHRRNLTHPIKLLTGAGFSLVARRKIVFHAILS